MKKTIIILTMLALFGCEKEEDKEPVVDCNCGKVVLQGGTWTTTGVRTGWWYEVRNYCTNAPFTMRLSRPYNGDEYCRDYQW